MNLAALLFDLARRLPEQPAVSDDRQSWNYRELARRIAGVAVGLRARGLRSGDRVLLSLENCGEFFELLFGCWAAGLCAIPANARLHPREVEYIAANSGARLLVATPGLAEALGPLAGAVDSLGDVISTRTAWPRRCRTAPGSMPCRLCSRVRTNWCCRISTSRTSSRRSGGIPACRC